MTTDAPATGVKGQSVRWTLEWAANEWGIHRDTLTTRVKSKGILPGPDGKFATCDINRAVFSDQQAERTGLLMEQKEYKRLQKLALAKKLCPLETVVQVWSAALNDIRQKISNWPIADELKQEMIRELQDIPTDEYFPTDAPSPEIGDESDV